MKIVEFYGKNNKKLDAYVKLEGDTAIVVNGTETFIEVLNQGIQFKTKRLTPKDGLTFMKQLSHEFSGSYFRASEVIDINGNL